MNSCLFFSRESLSKVPQVSGSKEVVTNVLLRDLFLVLGTGIILLILPVEAIMVYIAVIDFLVNFWIRFPRFNLDPDTRAIVTMFAAFGFTGFWGWWVMTRMYKLMLGLIALVDRASGLNGQEDTNENDGTEDSEIAESYLAPESSTAP